MAEILCQMAFDQTIRKTFQGLAMPHKHNEFLQELQIEMQICVQGYLSRIAKQKNPVSLSFIKKRWEKSLNSSLPPSLWFP